MKSILRREGTLSFSQKLTRLTERLRQPMWQKYGATMLVGKVAGVGLTLGIMAAITAVFFTKVYAADTTLKAADVVNPILRQKGIKSMAGVPLVAAGETVGVLHVGSLHPRLFTEEDVQLIEATLAEDPALRGPPERESSPESP